MGHINFIRGLIGEKISLKAQFELNWKIGILEYQI